VKRSPTGTANNKKGAGGINSYNSSSNSKKGLQFNQPLSARNVSSSQKIMSNNSSNKQLGHTLVNPNLKSGNLISKNSVRKSSKKSTTRKNTNLQQKIVQI